MTGRRLPAPLLAAVFACASGSGAASIASVAAPAHAQMTPDAAQLTRGQKLKPAAVNLLIANRYEVRSDGTIWAPGGQQQVDPAELPWLLARLRSSQRLKALLRLDLILSASRGEKYLTPSEREAMRAVLRETWPYFSRTTRKHFKMYFSLEELEKLNRTPPDDEPEPALTMRDPEIEEFPPEPAPEPAPAPAPIAVPAPVAAPGPVAAPSVGTIPGLGAPAAAAAAPAAAPKPAPIAAPLAAPPPSPVLAPVAAPAVAAPAAALAAAAPDVVPEPPPREAPRILPEQLAGINVIGAPPKPALPPASAAAPAPAPVVPAQTMPPLTAPAAPAQAPVVSAGEFEKFLAQAAYNRDIKALLRLISDKTPEPARSRALALVVSAMPPIYSDAERAGLHARAAVEAQEAPDGQRAVTITLNPGAALIHRKRMFFGAQTTLVPESPAAYARLRLQPPAADALKRDATAAKLERGPWGETRGFEDGSERAVFTQSQAAGSLLWALLVADAERSGWDASPYAAELFARTAQLQLYHRLATEAKDDGFLDPEMRAMYRQWRDRVWEFRDHLVHVLSASRVAALDPAAPSLEHLEQAARKAYAACPDSSAAAAARETAGAAERLKKAALALARARLVDAGQFEEALKALDAQAGAPKPAAESVEVCARRWKRALDGLKQAEALVGRSGPLEPAAGFSRAGEQADDAARPARYSPSARTFSCDVPAGWTAFEQDEGGAAAVHLLGPEDPAGTFRAGIDVRYVEKGQPGYLTFRQFVDAARRSDRDIDRSATPMKALRIPAGLARVFEITETRRLPPDRLPSLEENLHRYVAIIPSGDNYFVVSLASTRESYLDFKELFAEFLRTFRTTSL